jgi:hypothetical protein
VVYISHDFSSSHKEKRASGDAASRELMHSTVLLGRTSWLFSVSSGHLVNHPILFPIRITIRILEYHELLPSGYLTVRHGIDGPNRNRWFTELKNGWIFPWLC